MTPNCHKRSSQRNLSCSLCKSDTATLSSYQGGYVCNECAETARLGRDLTTQSLRNLQRANNAARSLLIAEEGVSSTPDQLEYVQCSGHLMVDDAFSTTIECVPLAGGELTAPNGEPVNSLSASIVALEASNERIQLVTSIGNDVGALALDTAESVQATGSVEQILAHQVAVSHHQAMTLVSKAAVEEDPTHQLRLSGLAAKWMTITHSAILTLKKFKTTGEQRITIKHVNVSDGGQAVIGDVRSGGK